MLEGAEQAAYLSLVWDVPGLGRAAAVVAFLLILSSLFSAIRLTLARASRPEPAGPLSGTYPRLRLLPVRTRVLGALIIGNILCTIAAAIIAAATLPRGGGHEGVGGATAAVVILMTVAVVAAEALARLAAGRGLVAAAFAGIGLPLDRYAQRLSARDEFRGHLDTLQRDGDVVKIERDMLGGLLDLGELTVEEVMVHRTKMQAIDAGLPPEALVAEVLASPYTRLPVWRGRPDDIVGVLHSKDLFRAIAGERRRDRIDLDQVVSPPWFVPVTTSLRDQLAAFLARKQHFALVVDEYGDLMGLVTLEDILEEIVGEIADEHDVAARGVRPQPDGSLLVDGSVPIRDLNRMMDWQIPDEEATTIAGLVIHEAQAIPEAGQVFTFHGFRFEVLRRLRNRIAALRVSRIEAPAEAAGRAREPA